MEAGRHLSATGIAAPQRGKKHRCSACGQILSSGWEPACPLCGFDFKDDRATGADVTPYAKAFADGELGWAKMCEWVWFSGWSRRKHVTLIRASAASRQFAFVGLVMATVAIGLFEGTRAGWKHVAQSPAAESTGSTKPQGNGWFHVASVPRPLPAGVAAGAPVDLWWNPVHSVVAGVLGVVAGSLWLMGSLLAIRIAATMAHKPRYRNEQRMTAALHYGLAWIVPILLAVLVMAVRPICNFGVIANWSWCPSYRVFDIVGVVLATFGIVLWWFWLVCMANAAPKDTRVRVVSFFAIGAPSIVALGVGGWWFGIDHLHAFLFSSMDVQF